MGLLPHSKGSKNVQTSLASRYNRQLAKNVTTKRWLSNWMHQKSKPVKRVMCMATHRWPTYYARTFLVHLLRAKIEHVDVLVITSTSIKDLIAHLVQLILTRCPSVGLLALIVLIGSGFRFIALTNNECIVGSITYFMHAKNCITPFDPNYLMVK
jgi:hypothetical protein